MPKCCIVNCPRKKEKVTYHRFPRNETLRRKWLEIIGNENINPRHKVHFICSQHFTECSFNRTLDVVRLHDNSVPSIPLIPKKQSTIFSDQTSTSQLTVINTQQSFEEKPHIESSFSSEQTSESQMQHIENKSAVYEEHSYSQQNIIEKKKKQELQGLNEELSQLLALPPEIAKELQLSREKIKTLTETCKTQRRKIKCLNERLRTRNKKIAILSTFVKEFKNSHKINNKQEHDGPKDFFKRKIVKAKGLPLRKNYSEEIRKFGMTVNFISPKGQCSVTI